VGEGEGRSVAVGRGVRVLAGTDVRVAVDSSGRLEHADMNRAMREMQAITLFMCHEILE
jgi:hypothetical protein